MAKGQLDLAGIAKAFSVSGQRFDALQAVDLRITPGEFITIVGASGCGKSTLLRVIAGLDTDHAGEALHDGEPIRAPSLDRGLVFQEPRLFPWLSVEGNIALGLENSRLDRTAKAAAVRAHIELVGLTGFEKAYPRQLSGGMAQRAAIARVLVNRPGVLLLDEPFGALDALTRAHLQEELQHIVAREGITAVLVTHDVDEAVYLGDRVVVMAPRPGRITRILPVDEPRPRDRNAPALLRRREIVMSELEAAGTGRADLKRAGAPAERSREPVSSVALPSAA